jgi:hypothetical protein
MLAFGRQDMFDGMDIEGKGHVDYTEFLAATLQKRMCVCLLAPMAMGVWRGWSTPPGVRECSSASVGVCVCEAALLCNDVALEALL